MTIVKPECHENAAGMLAGRFSYFLGWIGDLRYYIVDGKAWSWPLGGAIASADTPMETEAIVKMVRTLQPTKETPA